MGELLIGPDGSVRFIHDDTIAKLAKGLGRATTRRASHVEPQGERWFADMSPCGGPVLAGRSGKGFTTRGAALRAEVRWLRRNGTPTPRT